MIISASRRTDIPAFYGEWFMNRVRAGYCMVPNPFNRHQVTTVSLRPEDVDVIVFWTRNPRPLFRYLDELDARGLRFYFQYTILDHPAVLEPGTPAVEMAIRTFRELAARVRGEAGDLALRSDRAEQRDRRRISPGAIRNHRKPSARGDRAFCDQRDGPVSQDRKTDAGRGGAGFECGAGAGTVVATIWRADAGAGGDGGARTKWKL